MAIFDPKPNTSVAYEQPVQQTPSTGMALAELGSNFGEAFLDYRQKSAQASAPDQDQMAMAQYQDTLFQAQAARTQGNTQRAEQLEREAALGLQRNGLSVNENTLATYTAITGRPGDELLLSPEQVQLNQVRGSQEYESAFLATYASGEDMSEEERDARAISRVARQQGQSAALQDQSLSWTEGKRDALFSVVSDFEGRALGTLNLLAKEQGFVPQEALQQASLGWSETKRGLLRMRPEGVSDEQWSQLEDRISQIDAELETLNELSSAEGIESRIAADLAGAIRGRDDWTAGKKLLGLSILNNPEVQATLSTTLDMKDIADSLISDQFELPTMPTQTEGTGGGSTVGGTTPSVFDNLPEDVTAADAETNFRRARNLGALLNQTGPDSVSANPTYRNEFLQTTYVAFGAMNQISEKNRRFVTADGINETFNGKVVEGLRAAAQQNPVETESVVRAGVKALDEQFSIAQQQLTNTLSSSYLRLSREGSLVLDESAILRDAPVDQVRMLKNAVDEFYGGDIVAYAEDRGRKSQGSFPDLNRVGFSSRIASGLTNARNQLASVNAINTKRQQFMGLLDETVETEEEMVTGVDRFEAEGLDISYQGDPEFDYGRQATANAKPFRGVVFHHTATGTDLNAMVNYGKTVDEERGGAFGYHFYIGRDGEVVQGAPLSKRTNHILPTKDVDLRNNNAIGISLVGSEEGATEAQMEAARRLGQELSDKFGISDFYGHGEIQGNRQAQEGRAAAEALRNGRPVELRSTERSSDIPGAVENATSSITESPLGPDVANMGQTAIEEAEEGTSLSPQTSPAPEPRPTQEQPQERTQETDEVSQEQSDRVGRATAEQENRKVRRLLRRIDLEPSDVPSFSSEEALRAAIESGDLKKNDVYVLNGVIGDVGEEDIEDD